MCPGTWIIPDQLKETASVIKYVGRMACAAIGTDHAF